MAVHFVTQDLRAAEFFAGIGLVGKGLSEAGFTVVFANDIDQSKRALYAQNFDSGAYLLGDVTDPAQVHGSAIPDIELATASFPCTDLSLAGHRAGLLGEQSGTFFAFVRVLAEMRERRPTAVLLENVPSLASSRGGADLVAIITSLNSLGYVCDIMLVDARHFVAQSRPRLFIVGSRVVLRKASTPGPSVVRPAWVMTFARRNPQLRLQFAPLDIPRVQVPGLEGAVERLERDDPRWWDSSRVSRFEESLAALHKTRLAQLRGSLDMRWSTAFRRTRGGAAVWEIRADGLSGCLRTARGGSSRQAVVETGRGELRIRWMTPREYARLQGAADFNLDAIPDNQAYFGLGDAVCVPVIRWLADAYLRPLVQRVL